MKIVINKCYGGFGLSALAQKEYLRRKGKKAFFYKLTEYKKKNKYTRIDSFDDIDDLYYHISTKDLGKVISSFKENYFYDGDIPRDDPDLIAVVEKLGKKANGRFANLTVVEIPDGVDWVIDEYDGIESIEEKHRSWD